MMRANEARKGTAIMYNHEICIITEATHRTPGNLRAFMQLSMKGLKSGRVFQNRFAPDEDVNRVILEPKNCQYLYKDSDGYHFMEMETYESFTLNDEMIGDGKFYVKENMDIIHEFATKLATVHGHHAPETIEIYELFTSLREELNAHLIKEETILFPAIKMKALDNNYQYDKEVIGVLEDEHEHAGDIVKKITFLSENFTTPEWACNTFKALYFKLDEFINDLYQHIHLENNILFSKVK